MYFYVACGSECLLRHFLTGRQDFFLHVSCSVLVIVLSMEQMLIIFQQEFFFFFFFFWLQHTDLIGPKESAGSVKSTENLPGHNWADKGPGKLLCSLAGFLPLPLSLCDSCSPGLPIMPALCDAPACTVVGLCCFLSCLALHLSYELTVRSPGCTANHFRGVGDMAC